MKKWLVELEMVEATIVMLKFVEMSAPSAGAAIAEAKAYNPTYIAKSVVELKP